MRRTVGTGFAASVAVAGLGLTLSACGSSSPSAVTPTNGATFTGAPVTVMTIAPVNTAAINEPEVQNAATAAVKYLNENGGLAGHQVNLINCNDGNNANTAAACARDAVQQKAIAVVGGFSTNGATIAPILEAAKIPWVAPVAFSANELNDEGMYPILSGAPAFAALGERAAKDGCKTISTVVYDTPTTDQSIQLIDAGIKAGGGSGSTAVKVPTTTTDFSSVAESASKTDCAILGLPNDQIVAVAKAGQSLGLSPKYYLLSGALNNTTITGAGGALNGAVSVQNFPLSTDKAWSAAEASGAQVDWTAPYNQNTWAGYMTLAEVLKGASGTVTAATVSGALNQATDVTADGLIQPTNFTKTFPVPGLSRVFNRQVIFVQVKGNAIAQLGSWQDAGAAFGQ